MIKLFTAHNYHPKTVYVLNQNYQQIFHNISTGAFVIEQPNGEIQLF